MCRTFPTSIQRSHIEDVYTLHLAQDLEAFETGGLFEIGGNGSWRGAGREEVVFRVDFYVGISDCSPNSASSPL